MTTDFHAVGTLPDTSESFTMYSRCGAITGKVIRINRTVTASSPHALDASSWFSAADSSGKVAGLTRNEPAHTLGGRGGTVSPASAAALSAAAVPGPTDAK